MLSGEWTDGAFPVLDPGAFIAQLKPSTNVNSRTTRGTDGSSVKATWKWGTRARQIGRQNTPAQETAPAAALCGLHEHRVKRFAVGPVPAHRVHYGFREHRAKGIGLPLPRPRL